MCVFCEIYKLPENVLILNYVYQGMNYGWKFICAKRLPLNNYGNILLWYYQPTLGQLKKETPLML